MNKIKELRKEFGFSQTELAARLGIVQSTLSYWEKGTYDIDNSSLLMMSEIFDVPTDYILGKATSKTHMPNKNDYSNPEIAGRITKKMENLTPEQLKSIEAFIIANGWDEK